MILTRGDVKAIGAEAAEIMVAALEEAIERDLKWPETFELIRARMKEWKEREL